MIYKGKALDISFNFGCLWRMSKDSKIRKTILELGKVSKILKCSSRILTSHCSLWARTAEWEGCDSLAPVR